MATVEVGKELIWMKNFLSELGMKEEIFLLHYDNWRAIHLVENTVYRTRHVQRMYYSL